MKSSLLLSYLWFALPDPPIQIKANGHTHRTIACVVQNRVVFTCAIGWFHPEAV